MKVFTGELTLIPELIEPHDAHVIEADGALVGYYTLLPHNELSVELEHLFIDPSQLRKGFGSRLFRHAAARAASRGFKRIVIQSDPNAEGFYRAHGAELVMNPLRVFQGGRCRLMHLRL